MLFHAPSSLNQRNVLSSTGIILISMLILSHDSRAETGGETTAGTPASSAPQLERAFPNLSFNRPVDLQNAGDGTDRIFVVEQKGRILVFPNDQAAGAYTVFLDIIQRVKSTGNEEGLLGLAFHPDFKSNGYFYVNYTRPAAGAASITTISRFSVTSGSPHEADPSSEKIILEIAQPFTNHNGGQIVFGPDGFLYIATGDGGSAGDPQNNAQDRLSLLGKILRIDVDNPSGGKQYGIPADNPFANNTMGWRKEIWTWGMRNPWRFSYDAESDRWWCADVGQNSYEEINILEGGKNYGWKIMEGLACYSPSSGCDTTGLTPPILDYGRNLGASVTGGYVYRGIRAHELRDSYIYADFVSGRMWSMGYDGSRVTENVEILRTGNVSSFGLDEAGELYICQFDGKLYRFAQSASGKLELDLDRLDFGTINVNDTRSLPIRLTNGGTTLLIIENLTITGAAANDFRVDADPPDTLQTGEWKNILIEYTPTGAGLSEATLVIGSSDPISRTTPVALKGEALPLTGIEQLPIHAHRLHGLYPNPAGAGSGRGETIEIGYDVGERSLVRISVHNQRGILMAEPVAAVSEAGSYSVPFSTESLPSGIYYLRMVAGNYTGISKLSLQR